jgi:hypothetical protein
MTAMRKGLDGHIRWDLEGTAAVRVVILLGSDGSMLCWSPLGCRTSERCGPTTSFSVSAPPLLVFWRPCVSYQRGDEPEQSLLFRAISLTEECFDLDLGKKPARGPIGLVFDKHAPGIGITREVPAVSVRAVVKFSDIQHGPLGPIVGAAVFLFRKHRQARIVSNA